jgi:hypothetical protein
MPRFQYRCTDAAGKEHTGTIEATSRGSVVQELMGKGLTVLAVSAADLPPVPLSTGAQLTGGLEQPNPENTAVVRKVYNAIAFRIIGALTVVVGLIGVFAGGITLNAVLFAGSTFVFLIGASLMGFGEWMACVDERIRDIQIHARRR